MRAFFKPLLVLVDAGLLLYWFMVITDLFPKDLRFRDYSNEIVQAWNWSFFPLDVAAALVVFLGVFVLTLTFCAGFMAISFWAYYGDFEIFWWGANSILMIVPLLVFANMIYEKMKPQQAIN